MRVSKTFTQPSLAKQSFKDECDINTIMKRYERTGMIEHINKHRGDYTDATGVEDYHTSLNQVLAAQEAFASLPSRVRSNFNNDPGQFMTFVENPENRDNLHELLKEPTGARIPPNERGGPDPGSPTAPTANPAPAATQPVETAKPGSAGPIA